MGHGVVANEVAGRGHGTSDLWTLADETPDEEEARANLMVGEDVQKPLGGDVVGAIVIGEGDLVGVMAGDENRSEELGLRRKSSVGEGPGSCSGGEDDGGGEGWLNHLYYDGNSVERRAALAMFA